MFSILHIGFMLLTGLILIVTVKKARRVSVDFIQVFLKYMAVIAFLFDAVYWVWEYQNFGIIDFSTTLPLYI